MKLLVRLARVLAIVVVLIIMLRWFEQHQVYFPTPRIDWTPATAGNSNPGAQTPLTRPSSGAGSLGSGLASAPGSAYRNTVLGES